MANSGQQPGAIESGAKITRDFNILQVGVGIIAYLGAKALELSAVVQSGILVWTGFNLLTAIGAEWVRRRQERKRLGLGQVATTNAIKMPNAKWPAAVNRPNYAMAA